MDRYRVLSTLYTGEGEPLILAGTEKSTLYAVDSRESGQLEIQGRQRH